jgi:solute carrier family 25 (adenine nucleotide translocator) protein 4/5/6/31/solute carrier family 25 phosphate transporter 23/24/25/41
MDTVRRRMQLNGALGAVTRYSSVTDCVARIFATEGVGAFYRGLLANAVKATPGAAIQFVAYDSIKEALRSELVAQ